MDTTKAEDALQLLLKAHAMREDRHESGVLLEEAVAAARGALGEVTVGRFLLIRMDSFTQQSTGVEDFDFFYTADEAKQAFADFTEADWDECCQPENEVTPDLRYNGTEIWVLGPPPGGPSIHAGSYPHRLEWGEE